MRLSTLVFVWILAISPAFADSIILLDKVTDDTQLSDEFVAKGFTCRVAHLSRELDANGKAVLENGRPKKVPRYLRISCDGVTTPADREKIQSAVSRHTPQ